MGKKGVSTTLGGKTGREKLKVATKRGSQLMARGKSFRRANK